MSRTWYSRRSLKTRSEAIDLEVHDLTKATVNGHRILTAQDLPVFINENIGMSLPNASVDLTAAGVPIPFTAIGNPSIDGITKLDAFTFQTTKKGSYNFAVQLNMASASRTVVALSVDGGASGDSQQVSLPTVISGRPISHNFSFPLAWAADGVHTYTFTGYSEDLPTPGATSHVITTELSIQHVNMYYPIS